MRSRRTAFFFGIASASAAVAMSAFSPGCREATEIVVDVSTDVECTTLRGTTIAVGNVGEIETKPASAVQSTCDANGHIGMLVVVPSGSKDEELGIKVVTGVDVDSEACVAPDYKGCIVARRAIRFLPHTMLTLDVAMRGSCKNVSCDPTSTCVRGICRPAEVDPGTCTNPAGCGEDGLGPGEAGIADASTSDGNDGGDGGIVSRGPELSLGSTHTCARLDDGTVKCWGSNQSGQLGVGPDGGELLFPTLVPNLTGVTTIAAQSYSHTCALIDGGTVKCWGSNLNGALGRTGDPLTPGDVAVTNIGRLALGRDQTCALSVDGNTLSCWGLIGNGMLFNTPRVVAVAPLSDIAVGEQWSAFRTTSNNVLVVGDNNYGELGLGQADGGYATSTPLPIGISDATMIGVGGPGGNHGCALRPNGDLLCWGRNSNSECGLPMPPDPIATPMLVGSYPGATELAIGSVFSCVLRADARVVCWGANEYGEVGSAGGGGPTPAEVPLTNVTRVWAGEAHACARTSDGTVQCWGANGGGQLGDGTKTSRPMPMPVAL